MKKILFILLMSTFSYFFGQNEHFSSFNALTITYKVHPKFFLYGEGQIRGIEEFTYPDYYEIKGGVGYYFTKNHKPFVGIGRYANYTKHKLSKEEFRIWLQDVIDVKKGIVKFENRLRAEQSWFYEPQKDLNSTRNRFRYRLNISVPLNSKKFEPGTIFANAYDEMFVTPSKTEPIFSRNRVYGGLGYQIDNTFGVATGYLWQREFASKGNKNLHYLYFALVMNIDDTDDIPTFHFPGAD